MNKKFVAIDVLMGHKRAQLQKAADVNISYNETF